MRKLIIATNILTTYNGRNEMLGSHFQNSNYFFLRTVYASIGTYNADI